MGVSSKMSVCLSSVCRLSVVCLSVGCPQIFLNCWSDWDKLFFTKTRENEYVEILILELRDYSLRVNPPGEILALNQLWPTIFFHLLQ